MDQVIKEGETVQKEIPGSLWDVQGNLLVDGGKELLFGGSVCQLMAKDVPRIVGVGFIEVAWF